MSTSGNNINMFTYCNWVVTRWQWLILIVTSVNNITVPPLRTLRFPERKTCRQIERRGGL